MNKEKEIEAMAEAMISVCDDCEECGYRKYGRLCAEAQGAERLYELGYRKADEVGKETAKDILQGIYELCKERGQIQFDDVFYWVMKYGVEVDE